MRIKWLHLSDIHFNYKNYDSAVLRKDFLNRIHSLGETENFTHLFLSGDILHRNNISGEAPTQTIAFIRELVDAMRINTNNVIIVPGNHDHDRSITNILVDDIYKDTDSCDKRIEELSETAIEILLKAFMNFETVYEKVFSEKYYGNYNNPHSIVDLDTVNIVRLNTAWLDANSEDSQSLRCGRKQLFDLLESNNDLLQNKTNIAVGHHPIGDFSPEEQSHILSLFHRYNIGVYFCGHRHLASVEYYREKDVLQITCPGGYHDGYSLGGYVYGIMDTDSQFYKAEFYKWNNDSWILEHGLSGTDERGIYYFNTEKFKHNGHCTAVDFCVLGPHIPMTQLSQAIGTDNIDVYSYPYSNLAPTLLDWEKQYAEIKDFARGIRQIINTGNSVHLFPLAPIPMLVALGFELQKNSRIVIRQHERQSNTWVGGEKNEGIDCTVTDYISGHSILVVKISCSFEVHDKQIKATLPNTEYDQLEIKATQIALGSPLYADDVNRIVNKLFERLNTLAMDYETIHIFAAIPAGMAVEIGRNMLETTYGNVITYQLTHREYAQAIVINPNNTRRGNQVIRRESNVFFIEEYNQEIVFVPILGEIACGSISEAVVEADGYMPLSCSVLGSGEYYIIKAVGDSMTGAGIDDGDMIVVRCQETADDGQIVVALDGDCTTLKRIFHDSKRKKIILKAENPAYEDQEFDQVFVQGVAVKVIKNL